MRPVGPMKMPEVERHRLHFTTEAIHAFVFQPTTIHQVFLISALGVYIMQLNWPLAVQKHVNLTWNNDVSITQNGELHSTQVLSPSWEPWHTHDHWQLRKKTNIFYAYGILCRMQPNTLHCKPCHADLILHCHFSKQWFNIYYFRTCAMLQRKSSKKHCFGHPAMAFLNISKPNAWEV